MYETISYEFLYNCEKLLDIYKGLIVGNYSYRVVLVIAIPVYTQPSFLLSIIYVKNI